MVGYSIDQQLLVQTTVDTSQFSDIDVLSMIYTVMREDPPTCIIYDIGVGGTIQAGPVLEAGVLYVPACDCKVYAVDAATGRELWRFATNGPNISTPALWKDTLIVASLDHHLYGIGTDGRLRWKADLEDKIYGLTVADGVAYIGNKSGTFFSIDAATGSIRWSFKCNGAVNSWPAIADGLVVFGCDDHTLYCLGTDGRERWRFKAQGAITHRPVIADGTVYVGSLDHAFYAITIDGSLRWAFRGCRAGISNGEALLLGDAIVFGSRDGVLYCLRREDGSVRWEFPVQGLIATRPVAANGAIYFGSGDTNFYAITTAGKPLWKFKTNGWLASWPVVSDSTVYFGCSDCNLYAVDGRTGALRWRFATSMSAQSVIDMEPYVKQRAPTVTTVWRPQDLGIGASRYTNEGQAVVSSGSAYATGSRYASGSRYRGKESKYAQ